MDPKAKIPLMLILRSEELEAKFSDYVLSIGELRGKKRGVPLKGPTERLLDKFGYVRLAKLTVKEKETVRKSFWEELEDVMRSIREIEADFIMLMDDAASYEGPIFPRWFMEELYIPSHQVIAEEIRSRKAEAFLHADGNYGEYFSSLGRIWDALHPLDIYPRGNIEEYHIWLRRLSNLRHELECRIATGLPLEIGNEKLILTAAREFLRSHGDDGVILSNFHPPLGDLNLELLLEGLANALS